MPLQNIKLPWIGEYRVGIEALQDKAEMVVMTISVACEPSNESSTALSATQLDQVGIRLYA